MKRTLSKVLSCILAVMMVLSVVSVGSFAATGCGEGNHVSDGKVYGTDSGKYCYDYSFVTYKCVVCNQYYAEYTRAINANGHTKDDANVIKHEKVAPTCKAVGTAEYYECKVCGWKATYDAVEDEYTIFTDMKTVEIAKVTAHEYVADLKSVVAPTLSGTTYKTGTMSYVCKICGDTKKITITCNHQNSTYYNSSKKTYNYTAGAWTGMWTKLANTDTETNYVAATCTANGYQKWQCKECGLILTQTLSKAHTKDTSTYKKVAATCTTEGYESYVCSVCHVTITSTIAKFNHVKDSKSTLTKKTAATCTTNTQWTCSQDCCKGIIYDNKQINGVDDMLNHPGKVALTDYNVKSSACATDVKYYAAYYCATCAKNKQNITVPGATIPTDYKVDGTVQTYGFIWLSEATGTAHTFTYKVWEGTVGTTELKKATCVADGYYVLQCTKCLKYADADNKAVAFENAKVYTEAKSDEYHDKFEVSIIMPASCSNPGERQIACRLCAKLDGTREVIPATGHKGDGVVSVIRSAACGVQGSEVHSCSVCGNDFIVTTKALEHKWYAWKTLSKQQDPTCTEVGYVKGTIYRCEYCDTLKTPSNELAATGHTYVYVDHVKGKDESTAQTCTTKGFTVNSGAASGKGWYCTACTAVDGTIVTASIAKGTNHKQVTFETVSGNTACGTVNYVTYYCNICGFAGSKNTIKYFTKNSDHTLVAVASSATLQEYDVVDFGKVTIASGAVAKVDATCASVGYTIAKCSVCGKYIATNKVAKLAHVNKLGQTFNEVVDSTSILCVEGVTDYTCVNACCKIDDKTQKNYAEFVKHTGDAVKTASYAPTCKTPGYTVYAYECCHTYVTEKTADQLAHNLVDDVVAGVVVSKHCTNCDYTVVVTPAELEFVYDIKTNAVNGGKLAVTVSVKATSSAMNVWSVSDKFYVPEGFTYDKAVSAGSAFDKISANYGEDTKTTRTKIKTEGDIDYYETKVEVTDRYVTFVAYNSGLKNVVVGDKIELATLYFDIADDAVKYGTATTKFEFEVKDTYKSSVAAVDVAAKSMTITADDYAGVAFVVTVYNLGDITHDGYVNIADFAKILAAYNAFVDAAEMPEADVNVDGVIDAADVDLIEKFVTGAITYKQMIAG